MCAEPQLTSLFSLRTYHTFILSLRLSGIYSSIPLMLSRTKFAEVRCFVSNLTVRCSAELDALFVGVATDPLRPYNESQMIVPFLEELPSSLPQFEYTLEVFPFRLAYYGRYIYYFFADSTGRINEDSNYVVWILSSIQGHSSYSFTTKIDGPFEKAREVVTRAEERRKVLTISSVFSISLVISNTAFVCDGLMVQTDTLHLRFKMQRLGMRPEQTFTPA
jgi:hypothetical protein